MSLMFRKGRPPAECRNTRDPPKFRHGYPQPRVCHDQKHNNAPRLIASTKVLADALKNGSGIPRYADKQPEEMGFLADALCGLRSAGADQLHDVCSRDGPPAYRVASSRLRCHYFLVLDRPRD